MAVRVIKKSLAGSEDLLLGFGTEVQVRNDKNIEITKINASNIPYDENTSIADNITKKVDTLAALRSMTETFDTIWASGYHTKNDGAFGSHIFRLKGVKTTEADNGGTVIIATIGGIDYVYELQYDGAVNIEWFGAKGDGSTDDTVAIQKAILSASVIEFEEKPYKLSNKLVIEKSNFTIIGNNARLEFDGAFTNMIEIGLNNVCYNMTISDVHLDGINTTSGNGLFAKKINQFTLNRCSFAHTKGVNAYIGGSYTNSRHVVIDRCVFSTSGTELQIADNLALASSHAMVSNCLFLNASDTGVGVQMDRDTNPLYLPYQNIDINNCKFVSAQLGIGMGPIERLTDLCNYNISNCTFEDCYQNIWLTGVNDFSITNNIIGVPSISDTGGVKIEGCKAGSILSNSITAKSTGTGDFCALLITSDRYTYGASVFDFNSTDIMIEDNIFYGNSQIPIKFSFDAVYSGFTSSISNITVSNNYFENCSNIAKFLPKNSSSTYKAYSFIIENNRISNDIPLLSLNGNSADYKQVLVSNNVTTGSTSSLTTGTASLAYFTSQVKDNYIKTNSIEIPYYMDDVAKNSFNYGAVTYARVCSVDFGASNYNGGLFVFESFAYGSDWTPSNANYDFKVSFRSEGTTSYVSVFNTITEMPVYYKKTGRVVDIYIRAGQYDVINTKAGYKNGGLASFNINTTVTQADTTGLTLMSNNIRY